MKRFLQKSLFRLHALLLLVVMSVVGIGSAWAQNAEFDYRDSNSSAGVTHTDDEVSCTFTNPWTGYGADIYSGGTLDFTSSKNIIKIELDVTYLQGTLVVKSGAGDVVLSDNSEMYTWTGSSTSVSFGGSGSYYDIAIGSARVWLEGGASHNYQYTVQINNAPSSATLTFGGVPYSNGATIQSTKLITSNKITPSEHTGYYLESLIVSDVDSNEQGTITANYQEFATVNKSVYARMYDANSTKIGDDFIVNYIQTSPTQFEITDFFGIGRSLFADITDISSIRIEDGLKSGDYFYLNSNWGPSSFNGDAASSIYGGLCTYNSSDNVLTVRYYSTITNAFHYYKVFFDEECAPLPEIDYNVVIAVEGSVPGGFTPVVTVDNEDFSTNGTHSTSKTLEVGNVYANTPNDDWYYDVVYTESNHTFTVTYKEYLHYIVDVTGCSEETAGVRVKDGWQTYKDGDKINVKEELTVADLTFVEVNGYVAGEPVVSALEGHNATITVPYSEAAEISYTVTITDMPAGAKVMVEDEEFEASGIHNSRKTLSSRDVRVLNCPATHYTNERSEWFNEEDKEFNIVFTPYLVYTVEVAAASAYNEAGAGVKVKTNGNTYHVGEPIYVKSDLTEDNVEAAEVDGYTGTVSLSGNVFTVSYVKEAFIKFDAKAIAGYGSVNETKDVVTLQCWDSDDYFTVGEQTNYSYILTSTGAPIVKVEIDYKWPDGDHLDYCNTGSLNADLTVWTGSTNELRLKNSNDWGIDVNSLKVYLAQPIEYTIDLVDAPDGASVKVNNDEILYVDGTYTTMDVLNESSIVATCPETHYAAVEYTEANHTFTVTFKPCLEYSVVVEGTDDVNAGVVFNRNNYGEDDTIYSKDELTAGSVTAAEVEGYEGEVNLDDKTFTVTYSEVAYVDFDMSTSAKNAVAYTVGPKKGITISTTAWNGIADIYEGKNMTITSDARMEKIMLMNSSHENIKMGTLVSGGGSYNNGTWQGDATEVVIGPAWVPNMYTYEDFSVSYVRVYLKEIVERENVMDVASTYFTTGNVEQINSNLTFVADVNTEGEHSGSNGSSNEVPYGVILEDAEGATYTISSMLWWDNDTQVAINLPAAITTPGDYTLTIPEGVIPCVGNKANKEIVFTWHVLVTAPAFPEQGVAYEIKSVADNKFVTLTDGGAALNEVAEGITFTWSRNDEAFIVTDNEDNRLGGDDALWTVESLGNDQYAFVSKSAGTYMSVDGENVVLTANSAYAFTITEWLDPDLFGVSASALAKDESGAYIGTYFADYAWTTDDAFVFVVTGVGANNQLTTQIVDGVVPANTGVLLYSNSQNSNIIIKKSSEDVAPIEGNLLGGTVEDNVTVGGDEATYYLLSKKGSKVAFYWDPRTQNEGATLKATPYKAYLRVPATIGGNSNGYSIRFIEDTPTSIDYVNAMEKDAPIFNLQGKRVSREGLSAGVYVQNGKKFIVK